jgi:parallel beta-helix repeat protein
MARLPVVGSDDGQWGTILNEFLLVSHNEDGTNKNLFINVKDHGAVGDGTTDDADAIQAAFNAIINGSQVYFPPGTYNLTKQLNISGKKHFTVTGNHALFLFNCHQPAQNSDIRVFDIASCSQFTIQGLSIDIITQDQGYAGIYVRNSSDGVVRDCKVNNARHTGIAIFDATPGKTQNISILNNIVEYCRFGISTNGFRIRIDGNHVAHYWPTTAEAQAKGGVWSAPSLYYDTILLSENAAECIVSNNTIVQAGQGGIYCMAIRNCTIIGNTVYGCQLRGIELGPTSGALAKQITITGNAVSDCVGEINIVDAENCVISGNSVGRTTATPSSAVAVQGKSTKCLVIGNSVSYKGTGAAVFLSASAVGNQILFNVIDATNRYNMNTTANSLIATLGDGKFLFGQQDVNLYRVGADLIGTDNKLVAKKGFAVGNAASAKSLGKLARKMQVFDATGNSLGYVPIYSSIA